MEKANEGLRVSGPDPRTVVEVFREILYRTGNDTVGMDLFMVSPLNPNVRWLAVQSREWVERISQLFKAALNRLSNGLIVYEIRTISIKNVQFIGRSTVDQPRLTGVGIEEIFTGIVERADG